MNGFQIARRSSQERRLLKKSTSFNGSFQASPYVQANQHGGYGRVWGAKHDGAPVGVRKQHPNLLAIGKGYLAPVEGNNLTCHVSNPRFFP
jgi:hypothetical protein